MTAPALDPLTMSRLALIRLLYLHGLEQSRLPLPLVSYAAAGLLAGVDTKVMSERLGHANVAITNDLYQHVLREMDESAAATVAAVILGGG